MEIKNAKYIEVNGSNAAIKATIGGVEWSVPLDPNNRHYIEIQRQVKEGTLTIKDAD